MPLARASRRRWFPDIEASSSTPKEYVDNHVAHYQFEGASASKIIHRLQIAMAGGSLCRDVG
jgi:hypothetical protein